MKPDDVTHSDAADGEGQPARRTAHSRHTSETVETGDARQSADSKQTRQSADSKQARQSTDATATDDARPPVLRAEGLEKTYGSRLPFTRSVEVLDGASLELHPGEVVGVVGGNGSGKSTLVQLLVGTLDRDAGRIERRAPIGWCPQEPLLYDRLTVAETVDLFGAAYGMPEAAIADARDRLATRLDFESYLDTRVDRLSGGNRQKVNLAVALLHDPGVLLLDEPYTGFDWETYLAFWELTEELRDRGLAIVIVSHLLSERERFDRIYELRDGNLYEQDPSTATADPAGSNERDRTAADETERTDVDDTDRAVVESDDREADERTNREAGDADGEVMEP